MNHLRVRDDGGCGGQLYRKWIGIDITDLAILLIRNRLEDAFGSELTPYEIVDELKNIESDRALAVQNRHQSEWWAAVASRRPILTGQEEDPRPWSGQLPLL